MSRKTQPKIERLEAKSLLSGLSVSLTTDKTSYAPGQSIQMTLTETNNTTQPQTVDFGPSVDGFSVTHDGVTVWASNEGPEPMFIALDTLQPGQSYTQSATWNGVQNEGAAVSPTGEFVVHNQMAPTGPTATIEIGSGDSTPPPPAASNLVLTLKATRAVYEPGEKVKLIATETNTSTQNQTVGGRGASLNVQVLQGDTRIWSRPVVTSQRSVRSILRAGESRHFTVIWPGKPNQAAAKVEPGTYTLSGTIDGVVASTTIRVAKR